MQLEVIPMLINSDFMEIPLDKRLDLADYKLYGEKSHVFQNKDRLHSLYEATGLTMNDLTINGETLEYFVKKNKTGIALASVYGIENVNTLVTLTAMTAVANSSTAMQAVANSTTAMQAVLNSSTAMQAISNGSKDVFIIFLNSIRKTNILTKTFNDLAEEKRNKIVQTATKLGVAKMNFNDSGNNSFTKIYTPPVLMTQLGVGLDNYNCYLGDTTIYYCGGKTCVIRYLGNSDTDLENMFVEKVEFIRRSGGGTKIGITHEFL